MPQEITRVWPRPRDEEDARGGETKARAREAIPCKELKTATTATAQTQTPRPRRLLIFATLPPSALLHPRPLPNYPERVQGHLDRRLTPGADEEGDYISLHRRTVSRVDERLFVGFFDRIPNQLICQTNELVLGIFGEEFWYC